MFFAFPFTENSSGATSLGQDVEQYGAELKEVGTAGAAPNSARCAICRVFMLCFVMSYSGQAFVLLG